MFARCLAVLHEVKADSKGVTSLEYAYYRRDYDSDSLFGDAESGTRIGGSHRPCRSRILIARCRKMPYFGWDAVELDTRSLERTDISGGFSFVVATNAHLFLSSRCQVPTSLSFFWALTNVKRPPYTMPFVH